MTPDDRKYTKTHEWIKMDGDLAVVGITDHAQDALGDITFVELPPIGEVFEPDDECVVVESVKAASDVFVPVPGVIDEVNEELNENPGIINDDPYDAGWILKLKNIKEESLSELMSATDYTAFINNEE
jgi:glycine cleavage system H protein